MIKRKNIVSNLLFWFTLISPCIAFSLAALIGEADMFTVLGIVRYSWIMFLFLPFGILSFFYSMHLKKNNKKYKKNLIIAMICVPILVLFGSYRFIFSNVISFDNAYLNKFETQLNISFPKSIKTATRITDSCHITYAHIESKNEQTSFYSMILDNSQWSNYLEEQEKNKLPQIILYEISNFGYYFFYDVTNSKYDVNLNIDSTTEIMFIAYDKVHSRLIFVDNFYI